MDQEDESRMDEQIEWFHAFAEQSEAAIVSQASAENRALLATFVARSLPGHSFPMHLGSAEFAAAVRELRENESGWNRSLMAALIEADDLAASQGASAAAASLESFAGVCPWAFFAEVARNQAAAYKDKG